jgi:hypothetical protein
MPSGDDATYPATNWGWVEVARRDYDPEGDFDLTSAVVSAVADAAGVDPTLPDWPPLGDSVDVAVFESSLLGEEEPNRSAEFCHVGDQVMVDSDGRNGV